MGLETPLEPLESLECGDQHAASSHVCCENKGFQGLCHERMNERMMKG